MSKQIRPWLKTLILAGVILGGTFTIVNQTSAYPNMSANPSDPATCLPCHPNGVHGAEEPATSAEPALPDRVIERAPSAPYPAALSSDVVWSLYLSPYTDWDKHWEIEGAIASQLPAYVNGNKWDESYK